MAIIVPNSEFIEQRVTNLALNDRNVRFNMPLGVAYSSDPERVRAVLLEAGKSHPDVLGDPEPNVIFTGFGDSSVGFELSVWTSTRVTRPHKSASELYFAVFEALKRKGIEIPFPRMTCTCGPLPTPSEAAGSRLMPPVPLARRTAPRNLESGRRKGASTRSCAAADCSRPGSGLQPGPNGNSCRPLPASVR